MAPLRSLSNPVSSFDDPFAKTSARAGEVWFPFTAIIGNRGVVAGGYTPSSPNRTDTIQYFEISTTSNASDFGNLLATNFRMGGAQAAGRGVFMGGANPSPSEVIQYITVGTTGNSTDFGDLNQGRSSGASVASPVRAVLGAGSAPGQGEVDSMDYITIKTTGDATDFGNISQERTNVAGASNGTRGLFMGGYKDPGPGGQNVIDYITIATTSNSSDFGNLDANYQAGGGCSPGVYGYYLGGDNTPGGSFSNSTKIQRVTIDTTGNASSVGDLTFWKRGMAACASDSRGISAGGESSWPHNNDGYLNSIEYFPGTGGNGTDFGDLIQRAVYFPGLSGQ